ncbi:lytic transglycosylase domain-containing protein [Geoalkalibacter halelectricus]|uniref:Lytic transglycosylase domain-containing protein n=1 Tax=Geoalkalibacter halelectricus TaxID=2847045 RepID=A0ABY5ZPJ5_9BACT|nr:lytic transglycosylase domain-containing protein [Geoalkalibacter halelectricus]MDO3379245.1 lytic transglycosylase domain-containing protein [Geoalkalibacter halelectricus]UWZ81003.1 lytic transglycosylase domain-containing protein [Geoalkalibacter halelectricus]
MALDPLAELRQLLTTTPAAAGAERAKGTRAFDKLLENSLAEQSPLCSTRATQVAELMKLEMMAGLLSWDSEDKRDTASLLAFLPPAPPTNPAVARQKFTLMSENRPAAAKAAVPTLSSQPPAASSIEQLVDKAARRYQVAPELIKAVIKAESSFNPRAVSPAGAQGLMQLMPPTARELGVEDPFDPEQNIMGGTRYLRDLLRRYDGDLDSALAAYNWGMGNLARSNGRLPEETRNYQVRVKQFLAEFSAKAST